jgi:hypothetical protein
VTAVTREGVALGQRGGILHMAHGGMVLPTMLEPGERVFYPPMPSWVPEMNQAFPRLGGGGYGA